MNIATKKRLSVTEILCQIHQIEKLQESSLKLLEFILWGPAKKLHDRLIQYDSVGTYNAMFGSTDNRIELKQGCADKEPLILKVRINQDMRKFFHQQIDNLPLLKENWNGDFFSITTIHIVAINKHDYNNI